MSNNKSTIIGFVLMTLVFVGYMIYAGNQQQKQEVQKSNAKTQQVAQTADNSQEANNVTIAATNNNEATTTEVDNEDINKEVVFPTIENDFIAVTLSSKGAQLNDVVLKDYQRSEYNEKKKREDRVLRLFAPETANFNMKYNIGNKQISTGSKHFDVVSVDSLENKTVVTMRYAVGEGSIDHIYTIHRTGKPEVDYLVDFKVKLNDLTNVLPANCNIPIEWSNTSYQNERSFSTENNYTTIAYHIPGEDDVEDLGLTTKSEGETVEDAVNWISFKQQYFSSALICRSANFNAPSISMGTATAGNKAGYLKNFALSSSVAYTSEISEYNFSFYLGPNKYSILKELKDNSGKSLEMERIIPLGWVISSFISRWVVIPLFDLLQSWGLPIGLVILILTLLVKLAIFPLTYKSYLSTAKMRVIRPEIEALNAKYPRKDDAMKKQQEMMALYRKAGVSPMGGCLPMLIQMPILIAMFRFFPASIELRGQSFLWSDDLSSYDSVIDLPFNIPFYGDHVSLFCLLMTIVMFVYSYMNYKMQGASQPQMAGMKFLTVYMMPLMMLFWFNDYASGLCYYYLLSNLITILQTTVIRYTLNDDKIRLMVENNAKNTKGKKSRFQQRYEQLMKQAEAQQKAKRK